jgi:hypothetical protein
MENKLIGKEKRVAPATYFAQRRRSQKRHRVPYGEVYNLSNSNLGVPG